MPRAKLPQRWKWVSMKPGRAIRLAPSISSTPGAARLGPTATRAPLRTWTSARGMSTVGGPMLRKWAWPPTTSRRGGTCPAIRSAVHNRVACLESVAQAARLIEPSAVIASRNPRRLNVFSLLITRLLFLSVAGGLCRLIIFICIPAHRRMLACPNVCPERTWTKLLVARDVKPLLANRRSSYVAGKTEAGTIKAHDPDGRALPGFLLQLT